MKAEYKAHLVYCMKFRLSVMSGVTSAYCNKCLSLNETLEREYSNLETADSEEAKEALTSMEKYIDSLLETLGSVKEFIQLLQS
jgi:hypothetical protein